MDKSTPRPWSVDKPGHAGEYVRPAENGRIWGTTIRSADRAGVANLTWCDKDDANLANAALIVRAVNRDGAFDALVKALRPFANLGVGSGPGELQETYKIERNAIRAARAALALAKETP